MSDMGIVTIRQNSCLRDGLGEEIARPVYSAAFRPARAGLRKESQLSGFARGFDQPILIVSRISARHGTMFVSPGSLGMPGKPMDKYNAIEQGLAKALSVETIEVYSLDCGFWRVENYRQSGRRYIA